MKFLLFTIFCFSLSSWGQQPIFCCNAKNWPKLQKNCKLTGNTEWIDSNYGKTLSFYGGTFVINPVPVNINNRITISVWFRPQKRAVITSDKKKPRTSAIVYLKNLEIRYGHSGKLGVILGKGKLRKCLYGKVALPLKTWSQLCFSYDGNNGSAVLYINGKLDSKNVFPNLNVSRFFNNSALLLGCGPGGWNPFYGEIVELEIFDKALSPKEIRSLAQKTPSASVVKKQKELSELCKKLKKCPEKNYAKMLLKELESDNPNKRDIELAAKSLANDNLLPHKLLVFNVPATGAEPVLPRSILPQEKLCNTLSLITTPDEYESVSFVLRAFLPVKPLSFKISDLVGRNGTIPVSALELKFVKCHYQAGTAWFSISQDTKNKKLVPELLLNDPELVKVDHKLKENFLLLKFPDGEKYVPLCGTKPHQLSRWDKTLITNEDFPVSDAKTLQRLKLVPGVNQQMLLTCHVPENTRAGIYKGKVIIYSGEKKLGDLLLRIRVLPFRLAEPGTFYNPEEPFISSIYYLSYAYDGPGSMRMRNRSWKQVEAELRNMARHGIKYPLFNQLQKDMHGKDEKIYKEFIRLLKLYKVCGLKTRPVYMHAPAANLGRYTDNSPKSLADIRIRTKKIIDIVEENCGHRDVYFYAIDEATGKKLDLQKPLWKAIHDAGGKVFASGFKRKHFEQAGKEIDLLICGGGGSFKEAAAWHSVGQKIWSYGNPQGGVENPDVYRRNFGLTLYQCNYDGAATYPYWEGDWYDLNGDLRDLCMVYPAVDGVIDTLAIVGYREGVDDIRYATTLLLACRRARQSGHMGKIAIAKCAEQFLKKSQFGSRDLDTVRLEIINYILKLQN